MYGRLHASPRNYLGLNGANVMQDFSTLSIAQTARFLGIGRSTLYNLIKDGRLPVRKLGKRTLILRDDLDQFVAALPVKGPRG